MPNKCKDRPRTPQQACLGKTNTSRYAHACVRQDGAPVGQHAERHRSCTANLAVRLALDLDH